MWICFYQGGTTAYITTGETADEAEARLEQALGMLPGERHTYEDRATVREIPLLTWEEQQKENP